MTPGRSVEIGYEPHNRDTVFALESDKWKNHMSPFGYVFHLSSVGLLVRASLLRFQASKTPYPQGF